MEIKNFNEELFNFINDATCSFLCIDVIKNELDNVEIIKN